MTKAEIAILLQNGDRVLAESRRQLGCLERRLATLERVSGTRAADEVRTDLAAFRAQLDRHEWELDRAWDAGRLLAALTTEGQGT